MDEKPPKFFNWVQEDWREPSAVPLRIRAHMRVLWLHGARVEDLARTFSVPSAWVDDFVRDTTLDGNPQKPS